MSDIVSCLKVPGNEKYYVCFTTDYRVIQSDRFIRSRIPPPPPPREICRYPDIFTDLRAPQAFIKGVGVPCRLTVPCVIYRKIEDKEVAEPKVTDEMCDDVMTSVPAPENAVGYPTWDMIELLMDAVQHHSRFGSDVYRSCVFIGRTKAYPAPWTATLLIYDTMRALEDLGYLDRKFETEIVEKYGVLELSSVIALERFGRIWQVGFNFYEHNGKYEAVAMFWVTNDYVARKYALFLWDLHLNYTMKIVDLMNSFPDAVKLKVENYRNFMVLGFPYWRTYFELKGRSLDELPKVVEDALRGPLIGTPLEVDLGEKFNLILKWVFEKVLSHGKDGEQA